MPLTLGFHGCELATARTLLGGSPFQPSERDYDWLGSGIYFWEDDPIRAYQWAVDPYRKFRHPSLVGAVIRTGKCLDLTTQTATEAVLSAYEQVVEIARQSGKPIPENKDAPGSKPGDHVLRRLDCTVINHLFALYAEARQVNPRIEIPVTVRALFPEGDELYEGSGFLKKTHVQMCVRDAKQILGVFRLPEWQREEMGLPEIY